MGEAFNNVPKKVHPHVLALGIKQRYNITNNYFYMDMWPFAEPILYLFDPDMVAQVTTDHVTPKNPGIKEFMVHLAGEGDLVSSDGPHWKKWRSCMNPGFAAGHLMTLVPGIVDDSLVFVEKLAEHADKGEVFRLEEDATRLTVDIIGKVALDLQLGTQRGENEMITAMREQVHLVPNDSFNDPLATYSPFVIYKRWQNARIMDRYIGQVIDERFAKEAGTATGVLQGEKKQRKRVLIDLALETYRKEQAGDAEKGEVGALKVDAEFKKGAIAQIRTFIFAGHDTTSSTICYAFYELSKHPDCMARIRQEHDAVLGSVADAPNVIKNDPYVVNKLEYTNAVIKETLRLFPAASTTRTGDPGFMVRDPKTGERLPTEGFLVWGVHYAMQRNPEFWGETANQFMPSRFMPENAASLPENAWRPFEKGPRNCIGQDLAMLEARIILALTVRSFDFTVAYDSLDELKNDGSFYARDPAYRKGKQDLDGEEAYPILIGTAKPREGMPVRVKKVL